MNDNKNNSIGCTVESCKYHCAGADYCTKNVIKVGACDCNVNSVDATCCQSFESKAH